MEAMFGSPYRRVEQQSTGISILRGCGRTALGFSLCGGLRLSRLNYGPGRCNTARLQLLGKLLESLLPLLMILQSRALRVEKAATRNAGNGHVILLGPRNCTQAFLFRQRGGT